MLQIKDVDAENLSRRTAPETCKPVFLWNRRRWFILLVCVFICCIFANYFFLNKRKEATSVSFVDGKKQIDEDSKNLTIRDKLYLEYYQEQETLDRVNGIKRRKRLPDVIGIGVKKCGTGALRWMLIQHPMIFSSNPAEAFFFSSKPAKNRLNRYIKIMPAVADHEKAFEKTPAYFDQFSPEIPNEIRRNVPDAKTIVVLCDPVNRTFSDFVHETITRGIKKEANFEETVFPLMKTVSSGLENVADDAAATNKYISSVSRSNPRSRILTTGLYYYHLTRWLKVYDETNLHIVDGEELMSNPGSVMEKVQEFLGIPKLIIPEDFVRGPTGFYCISMPKIYRTKNGTTVQKPEHPDCLGSYKGRTRMGQWKYQPSEAVVNALRQFFAPYNEKLSTFLGRKFSWQKPA